MNEGQIAQQKSPKGDSYVLLKGSWEGEGETAQEESH